MRTKLNILAWSLGWLLCALALNGCGGGGSTSPTTPSPQPNAIPEQLYKVNLTSATNDCGADNGDLSFTIIPKHTGTSYTIDGIGAAPTPVTVADDRLTFSVTVPVESGTIAFAGDWTFTKERHTFSGTFTADIVLTGLNPCMFTFSAAGQHIDELGNPVTTGDPTASVDIAPAKKAAVPSPEGVYVIGDVYWWPTASRTSGWFRFVDKVFNGGTCQ